MCVFCIFQVPLGLVNEVMLFVSILQTGFLGVEYNLGRIFFLYNGTVWAQMFDIYFCTIEIA